MPVRLEMLDASEKNHVAVKGNTPWAMAAAALINNNGQAHWPLVVRKADGTYAATTFEAILKAGDVSPDTLAENLPGLVPVETITVNSMGTDAARDRVNGLKGLKLAVVVDDRGKYLGALAKPVSRSGGELPTAKLDQLAGQQADLSKLGDFLLDEV